MAKFNESADDSLSELEYKPIFGLSIVAFVLSLLGVASVISPPMVILNVIAAILAIFSISKIEISKRYAGMKIAQTALFLAVLFSAFSLTSTFGRSWYVCYQAKLCGEKVADLISEGRYPEAFQYTVEPNKRKPQGTDLEQLYKIPEDISMQPSQEVMRYVSWIRNPPISIIEEDGRQGDLQFLGFGRVEIDTESKRIAVSCNYRYQPKSRDLQASKFEMIFRRILEPDSSEANWQMLGFGIQEGPKGEIEMIKITGPQKDEEEAEAVEEGKEKPATETPTTDAGKQ
ncbi:MAG: hypothetical protein P8J33_07555 [Pirellulaceae bacterium]|nr:hypothetical protein [Pirellulaceae bacterium]